MYISLNTSFPQVYSLKERQNIKKKIKRGHWHDHWSFGSNKNSFHTSTIRLNLQTTLHHRTMWLYEGHVEENLKYIILPHKDYLAISLYRINIWKINKQMRCKYKKETGVNNIHVLRIQGHGPEIKSMWSYLGLRAWKIYSVAFRGRVCDNLYGPVSTSLLKEKFSIKQRELYKCLKPIERHSKWMAHACLKIRSTAGKMN